MNSILEASFKACMTQKHYINGICYAAFFLGAFFVLCPDNLVRKITATDCEINTYFEAGAFTADVAGGSVDGDMTMPSNVPLEPLIPFHQ